MFRALDPKKLVDAVESISVHTESLFPDSGLARVARELLATAEITLENVTRHRRPLIGLRILTVAFVLVLLVWPLVLGHFLDFKESFASLGEFMEATDAGLHMALVVGGGVAFLVTFEQRVKRNRALHDLTELRSLAHIIDMHQISKDPGMEHLKPAPTGQTDHRTVQSDEQLALYLDLSSDMLSLVGKLAADYAQHLNDRTVLEAVNEIEILTNGISRKLWQKVMIINQIADSRRLLARFPTAPNVAPPDPGTTV